MPDLTFRGTITQNIYNNQDVGPNSPDTLPFPTNGFTFEFNLALLTIDWGNNPPPSTVRNLSPFELVNGLGTLFRTITFSPTIVISTGTQYYDVGSDPTTYFQFETEDSPTPQTAKVQPPSSGSLGTANYAGTAPLTFNNIPPSNIGNIITVSINVYNECNTACFSYSASGFTVNLIINVTLTLICEGIALENSVCSAFCETPANLSVCLPDYQRYCLTAGLNGDPIITTSVACQEFYKDFIPNVGIDSELDTKLQAYCQAKYNGFDELLDVNGQRNSQSEIELCACNLAPQLYENLRAALIAAFPGYAGVAENSRCLFPQCVDSPYKNSSTTQKCALPNCINIASISNDGGSIGNISIIQGATGCANVVGGTGATGGNGSGTGNGTSTKTFLEQHWVWIILGVGILVVLIIVILIIIAAESDKPKRKIPS